MSAILKPFQLVMPVHEQHSYLQELGKRLAALRKERGLTQSQLGKMVEVTQQVIAEYERGFHNIPVYRLVMLADALEVPVEELLKDSPKPQRKPGPTSKLDRLTEQVAQLPKPHQRFVVQMLETAVSQPQG